MLTQPNKHLILFTFTATTLLFVGCQQAPLQPPDRATQHQRLAPAMFHLALTEDPSDIWSALPYPLLFEVTDTCDTRPTVTINGETVLPDTHRAQAEEGVVFAYSHTLHQPGEASIAAWSGCREGAPIYRRVVLHIDLAPPALVWPTAPPRLDFSDFFSRGSVPLANTLSTFALHDIDNDGDDDLITLYTELAKVGIAISADGRFGEEVLLAVGQLPRAVVLDDFNNDGVVDIVCLNSGDDSISVLLGVGGGNFAPEQRSATGSFPTAIELGDLNHDTHLDLITTSAANDTISVLLGAGDGRFTMHNVPIDARLTALALSDVNGDTMLDLVASGNDGISVRSGHGDGTFAQKDLVASGDFSHIAVEDIGGDGILDIIAINNGSVQTFAGTEHGTWLEPTVVWSGDVSALWVGDMDGNTHTDIVVVDQRGPEIVMLLADDTGTLSTLPMAIPMFAPATTIHIGDANGDGASDLVTSSQTRIDTLTFEFNANAQPRIVTQDSFSVADIVALDPGSGLASIVLKLDNRETVLERTFIPSGAPPRGDQTVQSGFQCLPGYCDADNTTFSVIGLAPGPHCALLTATDVAGNASTVSYCFTYRGAGAVSLPGLQSAAHDLCEEVEAHMNLLQPNDLTFEEGQNTAATCFRGLTCLTDDPARMGCYLLSLTDTHKQLLNLERDSAPALYRDLRRGTVGMAAHALRLTREQLLVNNATSLQRGTQAFEQIPSLAEQSTSLAIATAETAFFWFEDARQPFRALGEDSSAACLVLEQLDEAIGAYTSSPHLVVPDDVALAYTTLTEARDLLCQSNLAPTQPCYDQNILRGVSKLMDTANALKSLRNNADLGSEGNMVWTRNWQLGLSRAAQVWLNGAMTNLDQWAASGGLADGYEAVQHEARRSWRGAEALLEADLLDSFIAQLTSPQAKCLMYEAYEYVDAWWEDMKHPRCAPLVFPAACFDPSGRNLWPLHQSRVAGNSDTSQLLISEMGEGSDSSTWFEVYNAGEVAIELDNYAFVACNNGCDDWENTFGFTEGARLEVGEVWMVAHPNAHVADMAQQHHHIAHNGNDALGLISRQTSEIIDIIGSVGDDPVGGWAIAGVPDATRDHTLVRKCSVRDGNAGHWHYSAGDDAQRSEWIVLAQDDTQSAGTHCEL